MFREPEDGPPCGLVQVPNARNIVSGRSFCTMACRAATGRGFPTVNFEPLSRRAMLYLLLSFLAGTFVAVQTALNTRLGKDLKNPTFVSVESCVVGAVALALYMACTRMALPRLL